MIDKDDPLAPINITEKVILKARGVYYQVYLCFSSFGDYPIGYDKAIVCFHPEEREYYQSLKYEKRMKDFIMGRYSAKMAVAAFTRQKKLDLILIKSGLFNQPIVCCDGQRNLQVSITHCDNIGVAAVFLEDYPVGVDLERVSEKNIGIVEEQLSCTENRLLSDVSHVYRDAAAIFWTAKESLSKVLRTGLSTPLEIFEISTVQVKKDYFLCSFKNFPQYKAYSTAIGDYVFTMAYPSNTEIYINLINTKERLGLKGGLAVYNPCRMKSRDERET